MVLIMQSLRDILPVALTPPHAQGTALITYQIALPYIRRNSLVSAMTYARIHSHRSDPMTGP